ncbi:MAG: hypothetical protein Kow0089_09060 [Desulfobulbaceae bacterium]
MLAFFLLLGARVDVFAATQSKEGKEPLFSVQAENKQLQDIAGEIFRQTGYRVVFDEKWNSLQVSGNYSDVTIEEFCRRVFRNQNTSLLINDKDKIYVIRFFGDKSFADLLAGSSSGGDLSGEEKDLREEYKRRFEEAKARMRELLADPNTVDPVTGLTLGEIRRIDMIAQEEKQALLDNPETVDPVSGLSIEEIEERNNASRADLENRLNDPESVDPLTGLSKGDIDRKTAEAQAQKDQILNNPESVDPITGLTISEIRAREEAAKGSRK